MPFMQGMDLRGIKKHPSLIPLYGVMFFGCTAATLIGLRAAFKNPDVSWNVKKNPEPWQKYADKKYEKLLDPAGKRGYRDHLPRPTSIWD
ncbi:cytochrome c oxidase subunit NDUFA4-like isoform X1 [Belonocnema kinseyi]|uniref:cytochrome c oxidase subunit NDUFA4-like isoform X1 n=1 Tax=Belonocnema kinseyi TaxID=2817044 RepID=UPI00143D4933|nr:cytochrome c oxidase subunit NDUFA4-like isoform X1 [Belonocnema kinseyi]